MRQLSLLRFVNKSQLLALFIGIFCILSVVWPSDVFAWNTQAGECRGEISEGLHGYTELTAHEQSFPPNSQARAVLKNAIEDINETHAVWPRFGINYTDENQIEFGDGTSAIAFVPEDELDDPTDLGQIHYTYEACNQVLWWNTGDGRILEFDILLNVDQLGGGYSYWRGSCRENGLPFFEGTILHELMHALGAGHEGNSQTVMHKSHG